MREDFKDSQDQAGSSRDAYRALKDDNVQLKARIQKLEQFQHRPAAVFAAPIPDLAGTEHERNWCSTALGTDVRQPLERSAAQLEVLQLRAELHARQDFIHGLEHSEQVLQAEVNSVSNLEVSQLRAELRAASEESRCVRNRGAQVEYQLEAKLYEVEACYKQEGTAATRKIQELSERELTEVVKKASNYRDRKGLTSENTTQHPHLPRQFENLLELEAAAHQALLSQEENVMRQELLVQEGQVSELTSELEDTKLAAARQMASSEREERAFMDAFLDQSQRLSTALGEIDSVRKSEERAFRQAQNSTLMDAFEDQSQQLSTALGEIDCLRKSEERVFREAQHSMLMRYDGEALSKVLAVELGKAKEELLICNAKVFGSHREELEVAAHQASMLQEEDFLRGQLLVKEGQVAELTSELEVRRWAAVRQTAAFEHEERALMDTLGDRSRQLSTALGEVDRLRNSKEHLFREVEQSALMRYDAENFSNIIKAELRKANDQFTNCDSEPVQALEMNMKIISDEKWWLLEKCELQKELLARVEGKYVEQHGKSESGVRGLVSDCRELAGVIKTKTMEIEHAKKVDASVSNIVSNNISPRSAPSSVSPDMAMEVRECSFPSDLAKERQASRIFGIPSGIASERVVREKPEPSSMLTLYFDVPFEAIDCERFTAEILKSFGVLGLPEASMKSMLVMIRASVKHTVAEIHGPASVIHELRAKPLAPLRVLGHSVCRVEHGHACSVSNNVFRSISAPASTAGTPHCPSNVMTGTSTPSTPVQICALPSTPPAPCRTTSISNSYPFSIRGTYAPRTPVQVCSRPTTPRPVSRTVDVSSSRPRSQTPPSSGRAMCIAPTSPPLASHGAALKGAANWWCTQIQALQPTQTVSMGGAVSGRPLASPDSQSRPLPVGRSCALTPPQTSRQCRRALRLL